MTPGLGIDLVALDGFREQLADPASQWVQLTFTPHERHEAAHRPSRDPAQHLAARFAAKEAFLKAWASLRFGRPPALAHVDMREIEVVSDAWGRPALRLHGQVARALGPVLARVSLTHDGPFAAAVVSLQLVEDVAP